MTTLIAIAEAIREEAPNTNFIWVGTRHGVERSVVEKSGLPFMAIFSGKLRRYFSLNNFVDVFKIGAGFFQAWWILRRERPNLLISAGGFVSVPLHWAAWILKIPTWIHQQDALPGLANILMARTAKKITVALEDSLAHFDRKKTVWLGNPCRDLKSGKEESKKYFGIQDDEPIILAFGGGTGAERLNQLMVDAIPQLEKSWHVIHITGPQRKTKANIISSQKYPNYQAYDFLNKEMLYALNIADVVFSRAGFATLTELASLSKAVVLMPISHTHQESNAVPLVRAGAVQLADELVDDGLSIAEKICALVRDAVKREAIGRVLHHTLPVAEHEDIKQIYRELVNK